MELREANHILFCLRWGIGDVVIQTALLPSLRRHAGGARLTVLGGRPATDLLEHDDRVDAVVPMDAFGLVHRWDDGPPGTQERVSDWIRAQGFDAVLDPHVTPSPVSAAIWATEIATFESHQPAEEAVLQRHGDAVAALHAGAHAGWGVPPAGGAAPAVRLGAQDRRRAARLRVALAGTEQPVAIAPFASHALKRWPAERFAAVADALAAEGHFILLLAAPDNHAAERVRDAMASGAAIVPPQHLKTTAALLADCGALLANDTGLMHLGAAVGTPTVGIFGPSDPFAYRPHGNRSAAIGGDCVICPHRRRGTLQPPDCFGTGRCLIGLRSCIDTIDEAEVLDAVHSRIAPDPERRRAPARRLRRGTPLQPASSSGGARSVSIGQGRRKDG